MLRIWRKYDAAVILGGDVLCSRNPLESSCIPLSQYKIAGRVLKRAIACDRVATLFFERASDCTLFAAFFVNYPRIFVHLDSGFVLGFTHNSEFEVCLVISVCEATCSDVCASLTIPTK